MENKLRKKRFYYIDGLRGLAVVSMLIYHTAYSLVLYEILPASAFSNPYMDGFQLFICGTFILVSGISSGFSKNNVKRGLLILGLALVVSVTTYIFDQTMFVRFGILHFLGSVTLLLGLFGGKLKTGVHPLVWLGIFLVLKCILVGRFAVQGLAWLGFPSYTYASADYFPLLPWIFLYLTGVSLCSWVKSGKIPGLLANWRCGFLGKIGKYALVIYMLHQPVIIGFIEAYLWIFPK